MMTPIPSRGDDERSPLITPDGPQTPLSLAESDAGPLERTLSGTLYRIRGWSGLRPLGRRGTISDAVHDTTPQTWVVAQRWYMLALFFSLTANQCLVWFTFSSNPTEVSRHAETPLSPLHIASCTITTLSIQHSATIARVRIYVRGREGRWGGSNSDDSGCIESHKAHSLL